MVTLGLPGPVYGYQCNGSRNNCCLTTELSIFSAYLQGNNYNFIECDGIFSFTDKEQAAAVKRDYLKMKFNYYVRSCFFQSESNEWILK